MKPDKTFPWLPLCCLTVLALSGATQADQAERVEFKGKERTAETVTPTDAASMPKARRTPLAKPRTVYNSPPLEEPPETGEESGRTVAGSRAAEGSDRWEGGLKAAVLLPTLSDKHGRHNSGRGETYAVGTDPIATSAGFLTELYGDYRWTDYLSSGLFLSVHGYSSDQPPDDDYSLSLAFGLRLKYHLAVTDTLEIRPAASVSWGLGILGGITSDPILPIHVENRANGALILQGAVEVVYYFSEKLGALFDLGVLAVPYSFQNVMILEGDQPKDLFRVEATFGPVFFVSAGIEFKI